jgi:hypothetical protein
MATLYPDLASFKAMPRPRPRLDPVTRTVGNWFMQRFCHDSKNQVMTLALQNSTIPTYFHEE